MTQLSGGTVQRETMAIYRGRPLIVTLHPKYIEIREKGLRDGAVAVQYGDLFEFGMKVRALEQRQNGGGK
jgi:hypothetical protein